MTSSLWLVTENSSELPRRRRMNDGETSTISCQSAAPGWRLSLPVRFVLCFIVGLLWAPTLCAQTAEEHASHHPDQAGGAAPAVPPVGMAPMGGTSPAPPAMPGGAGGMGGMGDMMKGMMGGPKTKELYPALMELPDLPLAKRHDIEQQAAERMRSGVTLMNEGLDQLLQSSSAQNYSAMQAATANLREGLARFESGLAAKRALAEGKAPRNVALTWFKRDMNLLPLPDDEEQHAGLGVFHWFVMGLLSAFFVVMSAMYFFKMRRASALLQRIADGGPLSAPVVPAAATDQPKAAADNKPAATDSADKPDKPDAPAEAKPAAGAKAPDGAADKKPPTAPSATKSDSPADKSDGTAPPKADAPGASKPPSAASSPGPVSSVWKGILRVNRIFDETPGVKTFRFTAMDGGPIPFTYLPGQYLSVLPVLGGIKTPRSYTMASSPTQRHYCELTIKREAEGKGVSKYFHDGLQEGELVEVSGPTGKFTFTGKEAKNVVLIGGGVGITPLMSYIRYLTDSGWPGDIFVLYTCRHVSDYIFRSELESLSARHPKLHLVVTISRPNDERWDGLTGRLTKEVITQAVPDIATRLVYVCGPDNMMKAVQGALLELDVPAAQVKTEAFSAPQNASAAGDIMPEAPAKVPVDTTVKPSAEAPEKPSGEPKKTTPEAPVKKTSAEDSAMGTVPIAGARKEPPVTIEDSNAATTTVTFKKSNKPAPLTPDLCILEAAESVGVNIDFECRVGTCGRCKVTLLSGAVSMEIEDALSANEKAKGVILACQAKSTSNCTVDA